LLQGLTLNERQLFFSQLGVSSVEEWFHQLNNDKTHSEQLMDYADYKIHKILLLYIPPLLLIIGTIGNVLSFCVLVRKAMRRTSTYNYLAVLSFTDMLMLYVGLLRLWVGELTGVDVRDESDWSCKLISMAGYTVSVYSVWLLIAVTVERYIVTVHSLKAATMCTQSRAVKTIILILLILLTVNVHFLWTTQIRVDIKKAEQIPQCNGAEGYEYLVEQIWPWVDACLYCLLPFVIIFFLNCQIVAVITRRRRNILNGGNGVGSSGNGLNRSVASESSARVTVMLLTISFTFLVFTLPMNVTVIHRAYLGFKALSLQEEARYLLARTVSELLMYSNHSINFYLYLLTGHKFRQQLLNMLCPCKKEWVVQSYSTVQRKEHSKAGRQGSSRPATEMTVFKNGSYKPISRQASQFS
jgi:hypothetical protein